MAPHSIARCFLLLTLTLTLASATQLGPACRSSHFDDPIDSPWTIVPSATPGPVDVGGFSFTADEPSRQLWLFGGFTENFSGSAYVYNADLWSFNLTSSVWTLRNT